MTVARWMTTKLVTINKGDPVSLAFELLLTNDIRHLPVLSKGKLVGILTDRDLHEATIPYESSLSRRGMYTTIREIPVERIMTPNPVTIGLDTSIEQAAQTLFDRKIDCLPVKDSKGKLFGIITSTDILRAFIEFMDVLRGSQRIDVVMNTQDHEKVSKIIQEHGGKIISIGITGNDDSSQKICSFRIVTPDLQALVSQVRAKGYTILPND
jgi:acetoin utilization protein AcuB